MIADKGQLIRTFLIRYKLTVAVILTAGFLNSALMVMISVSLGKYYEIAFQHRSHKGKLLDYITDSFRQGIGHFVGMFISLLVLRMLVLFVQRYLTGILGERFSQDIRENLFTHQLSLSLEHHRRKHSGKYLLRYSGDLVSVQHFVTKGILDFACDCLFLFSALTVLYLIEPRAALLFIFLASMLGLATGLFNQTFKTITQHKRDVMSSNLAFIATRLSSFITTKAYNKEPVEVKKFVKRSQKQFEAGQKYQLLESILFAFLPFALYAILTMVLFYVYHIHREDSGIASNLVAFVVVLLTILPVIKRMLRVNLIWQVGSVSFKKLLEMLAIPSEKRSDEQRLEIVLGELEGKNISFSYEENALLFHDFSFYMPPNAITHIHGQGKSTLLKLIMGIYPLKSGQLLIDGIDMALWSPKMIRKNIALVSNDLPLVGDTIFEAVSYSRKANKRNEVIKILEKLNFRLFDSDPQIDLDYKIGEVGYKLSAKQIKQLLVARGLLTKKRILLLDDPFGDLDALSKIKLVSILNELKKARTIVIAANTLDKVLHIDSHLTIHNSHSTVHFS